MTHQQIVLASNNSGKIREMRQLLSPLQCQISNIGEFTSEEALEDGLSFVENAIKKARFACQVSGLPAIADDSGLEVDALQGRPGIYSARYAGEDASDDDNLQKLLTDLASIDDTQRTARFQCLMVYMRHENDPTPVICQGTWEGLISRVPQGENGFGYDPVFFVPADNCTAAELPAERKNSLSHRGQALAELLKKLTT